MSTVTIFHAAGDTIVMADTTGIETRQLAQHERAGPTLAPGPAGRPGRAGRPAAGG